MENENNKNNWPSSEGSRFITRPAHHQWMLGQAMSLLTFFQFSAFNSSGGFHALDGFGNPLQSPENQKGTTRHLHDTTRMVHSFAIGHLLGLPAAERNVDHGMKFIWQHHRDQKNGGYFSAVADAHPIDNGKLAYGHAFVLLAASSAKIIGHPDADRLLNDVSDIILTRFWDDKIGATREEFTEDWQEISNYRGQNSNMHLTEASMAAFEATGDKNFLQMAEQISELIINHHARQNGWRVPEHFNQNWQVDQNYEGDPMFRPSGTTPGHALEWSRLLIQLWQLGGRKNNWMQPAAKNLFKNAIKSGWDQQLGGFYYTLNWQDQPSKADKFWWPCAEGIAAAAVLANVTNDPYYETWYRRILGYVSQQFIDHKNGGWWPEAQSDLGNNEKVFAGKPDIYHALQACLIPLLPSDCSITAGIKKSELYGS